MDLETNGVGSFLRRHSSSSSNAITPIDDDRDDIMGNGSVVPIPANALATTSFVSPSTLELIPPLSTEAIIHSDDKNQVSLYFLFGGFYKTLVHKFRNCYLANPADNSLSLRFSNFECRAP